MILRAYSVLLLAIAFAAVPFFVPFDGFDPSLYPVPQIDPPVQPEGYAFAIWGPIYLWLIAMAGMGVWRHGTDPAWDTTRPGLIVSLSVGVFWLPVALVSTLAATVMIWVMLAGALWALLVSPRGQEWAIGGAIGLYAGWLTAASSVSIGLVTAGFGVPPFGQVGWALVALVIALLVGGVVLWRRPSLAYGGVLVWALVAIVVQNRATGIVAWSAGGGALAIAVWTVVRWRQSPGSRMSSSA